MTSGLPYPPRADSVGHHRVAWRLHGVLTDVLNTLEGTDLGRAFKDRAVKVSMLKILSGPVDHTAVLAAHRWMLERADGAGLPLTTAGYLRPADVRALAAKLPTMDDWNFSISREIDTYPVLFFREYLKEIGLLRKYKGTLRLTKAGREGLADTTILWRHIAETLIPTHAEFDAAASVVILVHAATTEGKIDIDLIAETLTVLGWSSDDGRPISAGYVYEIWNDLWIVLGNVGARASSVRLDRTLSVAARVLVHCALFEEVNAGLVS